MEYFVNSKTAWVNSQSHKTKPTPKAEANEKKHGISFDEARTVFLDENAKLINDPGHSEDEERFVLLGLSSTLKVMVVCHCYREQGNVIRIISARKATTNESKQYR